MKFHTSSFLFYHLVVCNQAANAFVLRGELSSYNDGRLGMVNQQRVVVPLQSFLHEKKQHSKSSQLNLFGGMFGSNDDDKPNKEKGELAIFTKLAGSGDIDERTLEVKYVGLADYIRQWSLLFDTDPKGMGLTTPVQVFESPSPATTDNDDDASNVKTVSGVRIVFQTTNTGNAYQSKEEERAIENLEEEAGQQRNKKEPKKEGGVEVLVEQLDSNEIQIRAQRCEVDEGTMIKEMSEGTIIKELKKAIDTWKKQQ